MGTKWGVGASPHVRNNVSTKIILTDFLIGLSPVLILSFFVYKKHFLVLLLFSIIVAIIIDKFFIKLFKLPEEEYSISSIITAVLLMLTLPINIPLWVLFFGIFFALVIGKIIFGGFGQNIFNPALLGRVFLMLSFPQYVYDYKNLDSPTGATILQILKYKTEVFDFFTDFKELIFGINKFSSIGETSVLALIFGFIYLSSRKRIEGKISLIMMLTVFIGSFIMGKNGVYYLFSGGVVFGAVYFLTDPVSSPYTQWGKRAYAIVVGILIIIIREFTSHPEGVAYAILFGNMLSPLFNKLFVPRVFGRRKEMKEFFNLLKLLAFTGVCIFFLNFIDEKYTEKMEIQKGNILFKDMKKLIPSGYRFDMYENSKYYEGFLFIPVYNEKGEKISYIIKGKSKGYSEKEMEFLLGVDLEGKTLGHKIISHQETLGLGSKIAEKEFGNLWVNKDINTKFDKKTDAASGATYTFLNFFKTIKEVLIVYDEKIINKKNVSGQGKIKGKDEEKNIEDKTSEEKIELLIKTDEPNLQDEEKSAEISAEMPKDTLVGSTETNDKTGDE